MRMTVEGAGVELSVDANASGRPLLLVHDLAADARDWDALVAALGDRAGLRTLAYDRRGYGASGAPEPYERTTVQEQAEDARAMLAGAIGDAEPSGATGGPGGAAGAASGSAADPGSAGAAPLAVGTGFGALIVLDLLVRLPGLLSGAVLVAPPLHQFSASATAVLSEQRALLEVALREGGPAAAVEAWRPDADDAVRAAHRAFFADFGGLASWPVTRGELRAIAVPVAVLTDSATPAHLVESADALAALLPHARRTLDGDTLAAVRALS
ncbi:alpha/beta fold hydrolase [Conexibacter sp. CPCC 206217]|uniref:alpha/beta fold hydrolase n=1 Tax=Conexibacter sp. CPCC 206217 TaxID=3064574 RepID=UPI00272539AA|nr:alpha/beta fold hydrolase [Conexibacter sp. CPCC 206217]MDO8211929.1 alpha/beta fold hydrolase [Conexibacter sp. CPCC 206217]